MQAKKLNDIQIMAWFLKPYRMQAVVVFILLFVYALLEMLSVGALYPFLNRILSTGDSASFYGGKILGYLDSASSWLPVDDRLIAASLLLLLLIILSRILGIVSDSTALWYHLKLYADLQNKIFQKILLNSYSYFHSKKHGELMYVGREASSSVGEMFFYFPKVGVEFFRVLIITVLLLTISVKYTLLMYIVIALFGVIVYILSNKIINPSAQRAQAAYAGITTIFSEAFSGVRQIKIFHNYKYWFEKLKKETDVARKQQFTYTAPSYFSSHLILSVGSLSTVGAIIYAKLYLPHDFIAIFSIIIVYVGALMRLMPSVKEIAHQWMGLKGLAPRLRVTYEALTDQEHVMEDGTLPFTGLKEGIRVQNLTFAYPSRDGEVLRNVSLDIPKGKTIAIVGESGSGKSTLADIIIRIYTSQPGMIMVDGVDYRHFTRLSWLDHVGMVSQDTFIFHASIRDNIRIGKPDATNEEIEKAAKTASIDQFIKGLPAGYDTITGDRGIQLSGGQQQRIALARAIVSDPEILILDEATSSLDNISEKLVHEALRQSRESRTTIIIAHRLSTVEHADRIFVLDRGRLVEEGTHMELMDQGGFYYRLYQRQKDNISEEKNEVNA